VPVGRLTGRDGCGRIGTWPVPRPVTIATPAVRPTAIPLTSHDVPVHFVVTPERVIDCRRDGPRPAAGICWQDLTEEKIAAIPLLAAQRPGPS
jgi:hypothetical protein